MSIPGIIGLAMAALSFCIVLEERFKERPFNRAWVLHEARRFVFEKHTALLTGGLLVESSVFWLRSEGKAIVRFKIKHGPEYCKEAEIAVLVCYLGHKLKCEQYNGGLQC